MQSTTVFSVSPATLLKLRTEAAPNRCVDAGEDIEHYFFPLCVVGKLHLGEVGFDQGEFGSCRTPTAGSSPMVSIALSFRVILAMMSLLLGSWMNCSARISEKNVRTKTSGQKANYPLQRTWPGSGLCAKSASTQTSYPLTTNGLLLNAAQNNHSPLGVKNNFFLKQVP